MNPKIFLKSIEFNNGEKFELRENSITVFVGANNVGKSVALKNIYSSMNSSNTNLYSHIHVISKTEFSSEGTWDEFKRYTKEIGNFSYSGDRKTLYIGGQGMHESNWRDFWEKKADNIKASLGNIFFKYLSTEQRIQYSNSISTIDFVIEQPKHPIHSLFIDDELETEVCSYFKQAFNKDLIVNRLSGATIHLHIGIKPTIENGEDRLSKKYVKRLNELPLLYTQGDGMRSFVSIILELITYANNVLFIDEPEAFLHPAQARLLGKLICKKFNNRQIFISTHSSDFIKGLLENDPKDINIVRIKRDDKINIPSLLNKDDIKSIWKDPSLRHSQIIDGLFHENVIVCESDGDCRFFSNLINLVYEDDRRYYRISDTLFIPSHGKAKIPIIVKALRKITVPTFTICDFDIFNDTSPLKELVEAHGGKWQDVESKWKIFKTAIDGIKSQKDKEEVKVEIDKIFEQLHTQKLTTKEVDKIKEVLKTSTAWSFAKTQGLSFIPPGESNKACTEVVEYLMGIGIYPLLVGELESFDKSIGNSNKSKWLEEVLKKDFKTDVSLKTAREFIAIIIDRIYGN